jgi:hypothetical protein
MATIITGVICFIVGGWFGFFIAAILAAGKDKRDDA